jgi:hypothetical protein
VNIATRLPPSAFEIRTLGVQGGIDRSSRLAVVACKHMGVNRKRHTRLCVPKPFRDRHDIHPLGNKLAGMGVPEGVECNPWHPNTLGQFAPVG